MWALFGRPTLDTRFESSPPGGSTRLSQKRSEGGSVSTSRFSIKVAVSPESNAITGPKTHYPIILLRASHSFFSIPSVIPPFGTFLIDILNVMLSLDSTRAAFGNPLMAWHSLASLETSRESEQVKSEDRTISKDCQWSYEYGGIILRTMVFKTELEVLICGLRRGLDKLNWHVRCKPSALWWIVDWRGGWIRIERLWALLRLLRWRIKERDLADRSIHPSRFFDCSLAGHMLRTTSMNTSATSVEAQLRSSDARSSLSCLLACSASPSPAAVLVNATSASSVLSFGRRNYHLPTAVCTFASLCPVLCCQTRALTALAPQPR